MTERLLHFFESLGAEWVLWLLSALAVVMIVVVVERILFFAKRRVDAAATTRKVVEALRQGGPDAARAAVRDVPGMTGAVLRAAMEAYEDGVDSVEEIITGAIAQERLLYDRWLPVLGTLGNSAPFVGLFGTVIGILVAFSALGAAGEGTALKAKVMGAIGEALVATAVGLAVAIPSVVAFNAFKSRIKVMAANTEGTARLVLAHLKARRGGDVGRRD